ncbi:polyketide synthase [Fusarium phyllophilum]|uniref:Polyketide synthase n=1 Tax=Fusarium phyllophilum TaxID=47803 RepID=A0A8H5K5P4_9HYPO|nr:polyketide synthase [Fusarium phyllophilum]
MSRILVRVTKDKSFVRSTALPLSLSAQPLATLDGPINSVMAPPPSLPKTNEAKILTARPTSGLHDITKEVYNVVASVSGIEAGEMSLDSEMADLGIDLLMGMELVREIGNTFHCTFDHSEMMVVTSLGELVACVMNVLARAREDGKYMETEDNNDDTATGKSDVLFADSGVEESGTDISTPDDALDFSSKNQDLVSDLPVLAAKLINWGDVAARETEALRLVATYTADWELTALEAAMNGTISMHLSSGAVVVVTGALGSLGSHIVQKLAERPDVATVVCINRAPISATRPLKSFEPQIKVMRNLLDLARDMATAGTAPRRIGFEFILLIGVTGFSAESQVLEQAMPMAAVIPSGYNEGKWVCEPMLSDTLRRHPRLFRAMVARPGQISGLTVSGFWNPIEHFFFVVKSAQALKAFPDLRGVLHWLPVDKSASVMVDLLNIDNRNDAAEAYPVYHVDNPIGQPWKEMLTVLAAALDIPPHGIVPFKEWIERVCQSSLPPSENPASLALGFLEGHFEWMACGGIILDT